MLARKPVGRWRTRHVRLLATTLITAGYVLLACSPALAIDSPTTVALDCGSGVVVAEPATCTVTVTDDTKVSTPTGSVRFETDSNGTFSRLPATCELKPLGGPEEGSSCTIGYDPGEVRSHQITATYPPDSSHAEASRSTLLPVVARSTTVSVDCGTGVAVSQPAMCTATVTDAAGGEASNPTGTVTFESDTSGGKFAPAGECPLAALSPPAQSSCKVEYTPGQLGSGKHTITAAYSGDAAHASGHAPAELPVSAPATAPPPVTTSPPPTTPVTPAPAPAPLPQPKCRVRAREQSRTARPRKPGARKLKKTVIVVSYTCDQNASVRVGGSVTIAAAGHGRKRSKARTIKLASVSAQAALGKAEPGVVLVLPAAATSALSRGVSTRAAVAFTVSNANGIGLATIRFTLAALA
jgi:hypothetical protein